MPTREGVAFRTPLFFSSSSHSNCHVSRQGARTRFIHAPRARQFRRARSPTNTPEMAVASAAQLGSSLAISFVGNSTLYAAAVALRQHVLTPRALQHALVLGVLLGGTVGMQGWGLCMLLFGVGSVLTRLGRARKEAMGIAEARGGARKPVQVWGAAGAAAISATASCAAALTGHPVAEHALRVAYASAVAAKMADTAASEVGKAYGRKAFLVTNFKQVKPGTDGAVSIVGTVAGVIAATLAAAYAVFTNFLHLTPAAIIVILAATIAFMAESFIGALWQKSYKLSNELVNFIQTAIAACLGAIFLVLCV